MRSLKLFCVTLISVGDSTHSPQLGCTCLGPVGAGGDTNILTTNNRYPTLTRLPAATQQTHPYCDMVGCRLNISDHEELGYSCCCWGWWWRGCWRWCWHSCCFRGCCCFPLDSDVHPPLHKSAKMTLRTRLPRTPQSRRGLHSSRVLVRSCCIIPHPKITFKQSQK